MPPPPSWYREIEAARVFLARGPLAAGQSRRPHLTHANGQPAVASTYRRGAGRAINVLQLLTLDGDGRIAAITAFVGTELEPFGVREPS